MAEYVNKGTEHLLRSNKYAYVTAVHSRFYAPGVRCLINSLEQSGASYPLVIVCSKDFPDLQTILGRKWVVKGDEACRPSSYKTEDSGLCIRMVRIPSQRADSDISVQVGFGASEHKQEEIEKNKLAGQKPTVQVVDGCVNSSKNVTSPNTKGDIRIGSSDQAANDKKANLGAQPFPGLENTRENLIQVLCKLHIWSLDEYDKLVFLDVDCMVLENIDFLFYRKITIDKPALVPDGLTPDIFHTGTIVLIPSKQIYNQLINLAKKLIMISDDFANLFPGGQKNLSELGTFAADENNVETVLEGIKNSLIGQLRYLNDDEIKDIIAPTWSLLDGYEGFDALVLTLHFIDWSEWPTEHRLPFKLGALRRVFESLSSSICSSNSSKPAAENVLDPKPMVTHKTIDLRAQFTAMRKTQRFGAPPQCTVKKANTLKQTNTSKLARNLTRKDSDEYRGGIFDAGPIMPMGFMAKALKGMLIELGAVEAASSDSIICVPTHSLEMSRYSGSQSFDHSVTMMSAQARHDARSLFIAAGFTMSTCSFDSLDYSYIEDCEGHIRTQRRNTTSMELSEHIRKLLQSDDTVMEGKNASGVCENPEELTDALANEISRQNTTNRSTFVPIAKGRARFVLNSLQNIEESVGKGTNADFMCEDKPNVPADLAPVDDTNAFSFRSVGMSPKPTDDFKVSLRWHLIRPVMVLKFGSFPKPWSPNGIRGPLEVFWWRAYLDLSPVVETSFKGYV